MKEIYLIVLICAFVFVVWYLSRPRNISPFSSIDEERGKEALSNLKELLENGHTSSQPSLSTVSDEELAKILDHIYLAVVPTELTTEHLEYNPSQNTRLWPYYYYSFPYNYKYTGAWPPDMYSRLNYWSPGFYTGSGLSYYMRPGIGYKYWPRNRWIRHTTGGKNTYYMLTNRDEYTHNEGNYADTPLQFMN
jgi:hypothetical protein